MSSDTAKWDGTLMFNSYDAEIQCEEYYGDEYPWHELYEDEEQNE